MYITSLPFRMLEQQALCKMGMDCIKRVQTGLFQSLLRAVSAVLTQA